jgi:hypothetical protein
VVVWISPRWRAATAAVKCFAGTPSPVRSFANATRTKDTARLLLGSSETTRTARLY